MFIFGFCLSEPPAPFPPGLRYTMHQPTVTTSVCLPWWAPEPASTSWTRGAAAPCTTPLQLTPMESRHCPFISFTSLLAYLRESCWSDHSLIPRLCLFVRCVEYLLRNNADPGVRDKQGYNAVHYASAYGCTLCLELVCAAALWESIYHLLIIEICT